MLVIPSGALHTTIHGNEMALRPQEKNPVQWTGVHLAVCASQSTDNDSNNDEQFMIR